jgi:transcriptional regulator with GAF, ATPase, and Fis domain
MHRERDLEPRDTVKRTETAVSDPGHEGAAGADREYRIGRAFVSLADTLVDEFDLAEFLHMLVDHCVDLLEVDAAGVLLADQRGGVRMAAASSEKAELLAVFAADTHGGPCVECVRTGQPVFSTDLAAETERWPRFAAAAEACGFGAAHALPMRLRHDVIGALSLLNTDVSGVHSMSTQLGQALADVATVGVLQQRSIDHSEILTEQLQTALNTRVLIEQAKGMLAAHSGGTLTPEQAFTALRGYARSHHQRLSDLSRKVIDGKADVQAITTHGAGPASTDPATAL